VYEPDDFIGTLAHQAEQAGFEVVIVTGDKDMFQLLTSHVRIYDPVKDKWLGEAERRERFGGGTERVREVMGRFGARVGQLMVLMGDATDNIPGVKGIGEKTAMKLSAQFGTIEELLRRVEEVTPSRVKTSLVEQAENARLSRRLATIETRAPVAFHPEQYQLKPADQERFADLLRELEFTTLLKNLQASAKPPEARRLDATIVIEDEASALRFVSALPQNAPLGIQCLLGGGAGLQTQLLGLALSDGVNTVFVPFDPQAVMPSITALLHDALRPKVVHDLKS